MASVTQKFVLVGPHAGKTMNVNGHEFVDGEYTFHGSAEQVAVLARIFKRYAALPAEHAELAELKASKSAGNRPAPTREELDAAIAGLPGDNTDPDYVVNAMRTHFGDLFTAGDELMVREAVVVKPSGKPTLGEAIGALDPENDKHWTSNNLPALDVLEELTGKKVARADVETVAEGYTRAKARAAKQ